jgi:hypothetical protein
MNLVFDYSLLHLSRIAVPQAPTGQQILLQLQ